MHVVDLRVIGGSVAYLAEVSVDEEGRINENADTLTTAYNDRKRIVDFINSKESTALSELKDMLEKEMDLIFVSLQYRMTSV